MRVYLDLGSITVMVITFVLFSAALFVKGFTHGLFLEAGVFLVSAKIMIMAYRNGIASNRLEHKLEEILVTLDGLEKQKGVSKQQRDAANIGKKSEKAT